MPAVAVREVVVRFVAVAAEPVELVLGDPELRADVSLVRRYIA